MFGILGILFSLELIFLPTDFCCFDYELSVAFYTPGIMGILASTTWLGLSVVLRMRNAKKDFRGVRQILKIKSNVTGSLEIILCILGFLSLFYFLTDTMVYLFGREEHWHGLATWTTFEAAIGSSLFLIRPVFGLGFLIYLVFASFKIHGVRTDNNRFPNSYIIFNMSIFILC